MHILRVFNASYNILLAHVSIALYHFWIKPSFPTRCHFHHGFRPCSWHSLLSVLWRLLSAGKCKPSVTSVLQKESLQCNFLLAQKWTVMGESGCNTDHSFPLCNETNPRTGEPGNSPFKTARHERPLFYNVWWLLAGVLVVCRGIGTPLVLIYRAQKSILSACPVHTAHGGLQLLLCMTCP